MIKNGTRLQSQVCDTQVIVVRTADSLDDLRAGGAPMVPIGDREVLRLLTLDPALSDGNLMGKRYVDENGAEVLVTKAGAGHAVGRDDGVDRQRSQATSCQRLSRCPRAAAATRVSPLVLPKLFFPNASPASGVLRRRHCCQEVGAVPRLGYWARVS